jgi:hypothetical protein
LIIKYLIVSVLHVVIKQPNNQAISKLT